MDFSTFATYLEKLEKISARLEITAILAELFKKASAEEIANVSYLSLGRLAPFYEGIEMSLAERMVIRALTLAYGEGETKVTASYKKLGDLGEVAAKLSSQLPAKSAKLTVTEVHTQLYQIATTSGAGSQAKKLNLLSVLLKNSDPLSAKYLIRIIINKLRLGFSDKTLIEALSWMATGGKGLKGELERAYFVHPDIGELAANFKKDGLRGLNKMQVAVGVPVMPQLCQRVPTATDIMEKMGSVTCEPKFDGTRVQLHMDRGQRTDDGGQVGLDLWESKKPKYLVRTFTRNLEENTGMFPDLIAAADKQLDASSVILDGEAVGINPKTGQLLPFQETVQRKRKHGIAAKAAEIPLRLFVFDLLYLNGRSLMSLPLHERRELLREVVKEPEASKQETLSGGLRVAEHTVISSAKELDRALDKAHAGGLEGLVLKDPASSYEAGSRGFSWVKFKRGGESDETGKLSDTIDAVVLGYDKGEGKRTAFGIGAFLVGVFDEAADRFVTIAKIGTGLSDEQWGEMRRRCDELKLKEPLKNVIVNKMLTPDVWVTPKMVVVIRADEITRSPVHSAGYALRFPRLLSWREDKTAEQATSLKEFQDLYLQQS